MLLFRIAFSIVVGSMAILTSACNDKESETNNVVDLRGGGGGAGGVGGSVVSGVACFTAVDCQAGQYCRANDPTLSPEGVCRDQEAVGGLCVAGLDCAPGLFCQAYRGEVRGQCIEFPAVCADAPTCICALDQCASLAGSSCSPSNPEDPGNTIRVTCSGGRDDGSPGSGGMGADMGTGGAGGEMPRDDGPGNPVDVADCQAVVDCYNECSDDACAERCFETGNPNGTRLLRDFLDCAESRCPDGFTVMCLENHCADVALACFGPDWNDTSDINPRGCRYYLECLGRCVAAGSSVCPGNCREVADREAQQLMDDFIACMDSSGCETNDCIEVECASEISACMAD